MKVSMYALHARRIYDWPDPVAAIKHYHDMGIVEADGLESELAALPLPEYKKYINDAGMEMGALVGLSDFITAEGKVLEENTARIKGLIDELSHLGVPKIMLAPMVTTAFDDESFYAMREKMVEGFGSMVEYAKGSGVTVMIENQSVPQRADSYIKDCRYILDQVPGLGFVLDAGNFFCVGDDVLEAYEVMKDRIIHCHVKDWEYHPYGGIVRSNMPAMRSALVMGEGLLPLDTLLKRMKSDGYEGSLVLEINGIRHETKRIIDDAARFLLAHA